MHLLWWMLILSRLSDWTDGFIFIRPERYTGKPAPAAVCGSNTRLQMCTDGLQGFNYKGETTMEFFNSAVEELCCGSSADSGGGSGCRSRRLGRSKSAGRLWLG